MGTGVYSLSWVMQDFLSSTVVQRCFAQFAGYTTSSSAISKPTQKQVVRVSEPHFLDAIWARHRKAGQTKATSKPLCRHPSLIPPVDLQMAKSFSLTGGAVSRSGHWPSALETQNDRMGWLPR